MSKEALEKLQQYGVVEKDGEKQEYVLKTSYRHLYLILSEGKPIGEPTIQWNADIENFPRLAFDLNEFYKSYQTVQNIVRTHPYKLDGEGD